MEIFLIEIDWVTKTWAFLVVAGVSPPREFTPFLGRANEFDEAAAEKSRKFKKK